MPKMDQAGIDEYRTKHLPYVLGVMRGHKKLTDRGPYHGDVDILHATFVSSVAAGRMLPNFIGITLDRTNSHLKKFRPNYPDDVTMEDLGGRMADVDALNRDAVRRDLLAGFIKMADKAAAHMTVPEKRPWERTHEAMAEIEGLLEDSKWKA